MKLFGCALVVALALGCSHSPSKEASVVEPSFKDVTYLKKGDREPATAPQLIWRPGTLTVQVKSQASNASGRVEVNQEMIWTETETVREMRNEYRDVEVPGQCSDFVCKAGSSKSILWDNYFSATKEKKADTLAKAIQGIGDVSSQALVAKKFFSSKPTSWQAFTAEINRAAQADVIKKSVATSVLSTYKYENIANLGYSRDTCKEVVTSCTLIIPKLVAVPYNVQKSVERRRIVQTKSFDVNVEVTGALLATNEVDKLLIKVDENGSVIDVDASGYNRYVSAAQSLSGQTVSIAIKADARVLRDLPNSVVRQETYQLVGGTPTLILDIDSQYLPTSEDPNAQLVIDYKVRICKYNFMGFCGGDWETQELASAPITGNRLVIPISVPAKHKSDVQYKISRRNSVFFNDRGTPERTTDTVKTAK